ncbi:MAG: hypothetical protein PHD10_01455 [Bacilli bacterium]|nr:hypothetical protein [Bacilli bacterium]MDD4607789.1 hypothetical protein [Bacilli bacterium]
MRRAQIKIYAEITEQKYHMTPNSYYCQVSTDNPNDIKYEDGMISVRFYHIAEILKDGEIVKGVLNDQPKYYYFGSIKTLEELKQMNSDHKLDILIENIERNKESNYIGVVTSPTGFNSLVTDKDVILEPKIRSDKFQNKIKILKL